VVQGLPSLHDAPSAFAGFEHAPVAGLHVPASWHWSDAVQATGLAPAQVPAWQASDCVHALPSLQALPFGLAGLEQAPFAGLQTPAVWHWSSAAHVTGFVPLHVPAWHASVCVHGLPSSHVVPFAAAGFEHVPVSGLHVPATWH